jgi:hypothetical protein
MLKISPKGYNVENLKKLKVTVIVCENIFHVEIAIFL